ncbi:DUF1415 domain-containing protein [Lacisediminimonas sp.]|uniref:DUF1415 domain-containing protein n=1 Tax=Lacisediminimonas sp. TaxID=3060582 RepID=UPI00272C7FF7|nr:DUF1415 domain-containing protein [Lacisediminimonas sp.]
MASPDIRTATMVDDNNLINDTRRWVDEAVIGLNLCPFAKAVQVRGQIRYTVSRATDSESLSADLLASLHELATAAPDVLDTILLIHPLVLADFADYNDYLELVDLIIEQAEYEGVLQVASFHPDYQFADSPADDRANFTNRSPYPMLHLLREESISRAVDSLPDPSSVYLRNIDLLRELPQDQFERIWTLPPDR